MNKIEHLLTCLSEECAEIQQVVGKAQRFGLDDSYPGETETNAQAIARECTDLLGILELLKEEGVLKDIGDSYAISSKMGKVRHYMEYARERGTLID